MIAGVLAYLSTQASAYSSSVFPILASFLFGLAILGLVSCVKINKLCNAYTEALENIIVDALNVKSENLRLRRYLGYHLIKSPKGIFGIRIEVVSFTYKAIYFLSSILWFNLLIYSLLGFHSTQSLIWL
jgi:hypothetical protein